MITAYHRPHALSEALGLLARPGTRPLGGGTLLNLPNPETYEVVDLQALGLDKIRKTGEKLIIGPCCTLQALHESPHLPDALHAAIRLEAPLNLRNVGTVAGALVGCDGRSPFAAVMLALEAKCTLAGRDSSEGIGLGDLLPLRAELLRGKLITQVEIPLNVQLAYEYVARTPDDRPIVCAALAQWASSRTRLVIGGWGAAPTVAMDGRQAAGIEPAARNAAQDSGDEWASAEYRSATAAVLAGRCRDTIAPLHSAGKSSPRS
jgi:putative selenate reductase FAD-binding subunit